MHEGALTPKLLAKERALGLTYKKIAEKYGQTLGSVKWMAGKNGLTRPVDESRPPFEVRPEHRRDKKGNIPYPYRMLLIHAALRNGEDVAESQREKHRRWMDRLRRDHSVVLYLPLGGNAGWHYVDGDPDAGDWPVHEHTLNVAMSSN